MSDYLFFQAVTKSIAEKYHSDVNVMYQLVTSIYSSSSSRRKWTPAMVQKQMNQKMQDTNHSNLIISPQITNQNDQIVGIIPYEIPTMSEQFVVGLTDADGSFRVGLSADIKSWPLVRITLYFDLGVHSENIELLYQIQQQYFQGKGRVLQNKSSNYTYLRIQCLKDILEIVIPFYLRNLLQSVKYFDFEMFTTVAYLMKFNKHKTLKGVEEIIELVYSLYPQGNVKQSARQYSKEQYIEFVNLARDPREFQDIRHKLAELREEIMYRTR